MIMEMKLRILTVKQSDSWEDMREEDMREGNGDEIEDFVLN